MTPAERARQIDEEERRAESAAILKRALAYAEECRMRERARVEAAMGTESKQIKRKISAGRPATLYHHNGESKTLTEWAVTARISRRALLDRLASGMAFATAVTAPKMGRRAEQHAINGVSKTLAEWAKYAGCNYSTIIGRMRRRSLAEAVAMSRPLPEPDRPTGGYRHDCACERLTSEARSSNLASARAPSDVSSISSSVLNAAYPLPIALDTVMGFNSSDEIRSVPLSSSCRSSLMTDPSEAGIAKISLMKSDDEIRVCVPSGAESNGIEPRPTNELLAESGVVLNLPASLGTGGGSTAQETSNIDFSKDAAE